MNLPPFIVNHGEKLVVALVILGGLFWVWSVANDERTIPEVSESVISDYQTLIQQAESKPGYPKPKPREDRHRRLLDRLNVDLSEEQVVAFLHEHPSYTTDLGSAADKVEDDIYSYVFMVPRPAVSVAVLPGQFVVTVQVPAPTTTPDARINDHAAKVWERVPRQGVVRNSGRRLGVILERRVGNGDWQPLATPGNPIGFLPLVTGTQAVPVEDIEQWRTYAFRARMVVAATGIGGDKVTLGSEVVVVDRDQFPRQGGIDWQILLARALGGNVPGQLKAADLSLPGADIPPPQRVYLGNWGEEASRQAPSSIQVALDRLNSLSDPPEAVLLVTRKYPQGWTPPQTFKVPLGAKVGHEVEVPIPWQGNLTTFVDLSTPFVVKSLDSQALRTLYYEIRLSRASGRAELTVRSKAKPSDTVVLDNAITGQQTTLVKLDRIYATQPESERLKLWPVLPPLDQAIDEEQAFSANPGAFTMPILVPDPPIEHQPGSGPIVGHANVLNQPEVPYYELPDGRLLYIDPLNERAGIQQVQAVKADAQP